MKAPELVRHVARAVAAAGGRAWVVGGSVRDALLGRPGKDWDLEVHGLSADELRLALARFRASPPVGQSFAVTKVRGSDLEVDVALAPAAPEGVDPMDHALRRRDLTINAIAWDPLSGARLDRFGGLQDLDAGRLRAVDPLTFLDDPARVLRVAVFAARLEMTPDDALIALCQTADLRGLPAERVGLEIDKLLLRAARPSVGLAWARRLGALAQVLPELAGAPAEAVERALDRAAGRREEAGPTPRPLTLMLAAMLHPLTPPEVVRSLDRLAVHSLEHYPMRKRCLGAVARWRELVVPVSDATLRRLAETEEVGLVAWTAWAVSGQPCAAEAVARAEALGVRYGALPPLLYGRDLAALGIRPGPRMGGMLATVREAQLEGFVSDPDAALDLLRRLGLAEPHPTEGR